MPRKKKAKTYEDWVSEIVTELRTGPVIWQFDKPAPVDGVIMGDPVVIEGASPNWKLTLKATPDYCDTVHYSGAATKDDSETVVALPTELCKEIFDIAYQILTKKRYYVWKKSDTPLGPIIGRKAPC